MESSILLMVQKSGDHQLRLVVYPIFYRVLYFQGGCLGFQPSRVAECFERHRKSDLQPASTREESTPLRCPVGS